MSLNLISTVFLLITGALLLWLPGRWAAFPLLAGACYMTLAQGIEAGPFHFPVIRILLLIGIIRVVIRGERPVGGMNRLDWLMLIFACLTLVSSLFHKDPSSALIFRLGFAFNVCGVYILTRIFCQSIEDIEILFFIIAVLLIPVALAMFYEKIFSYNIFSIFGGVNAFPAIREGKVRAAGPFLHPILAGTIGAACIPFMIGLWKENRRIALFGLLSCVIIIFSCASTGPIMSAVVGIVALYMWRYKQHMRLVRWLMVLGYIFLDIVMKAPAYYLIGRMDLVGGSSGYHRPALIQAAISHIGEWWLWGTDYTRHWMPTGVTWSEDHTDITNYYIHIGILGGLPLLLLFIAILSKGFSFVGQSVRNVYDENKDCNFLIWSVGASLFVHTLTFLSVSYFDQSFLFIYMTLGIISSVSSIEINNNINTIDVDGFTN